MRGKRPSGSKGSRAGRRAEAGMLAQVALGHTAEEAVTWGYCAQVVATFSPGPA